jgi:hypothetical protein
MPLQTLSLRMARRAHCVRGVIIPMIGLVEALQTRGSAERWGDVIGGKGCCLFSAMHG